MSTVGGPERAWRRPSGRQRPPAPLAGYGVVSAAELEPSDLAVVARDVPQGAVRAERERVGSASHTQVAAQRPVEGDPTERARRMLGDPQPAVGGRNEPNRVG